MAICEHDAERAEYLREQREDNAMVRQWEIERIQRAKSFRHRIAVYTGEIS